MIQNGKLTPASIDEYVAIGMLLNTDESQVDAIGCATVFNMFSRMQATLSANCKKWRAFHQKKSKLTPEDIDRAISVLLEGNRKTVLLLIVGFNYVDFCFDDRVDVIWIGPKDIGPKLELHENQYVIDVRTSIHTFDDVDAISMCEDCKYPEEFDLLRPVRMLCEEFSKRDVQIIIPRVVFLTIILQTLTTPPHTRVYDISYAVMSRIIYSIVVSYNPLRYTDIYASIYNNEQMVPGGSLYKNLNIEQFLPIIPEMLLKLYGWEFTCTLYREIVDWPESESAFVSQTFDNPQMDSDELQIVQNVNEPANKLIGKTLDAAFPAIHNINRDCEYIVNYIAKHGFFPNPFPNEENPQFIKNIILIPWHTDFPHIISSALLRQFHRLDAVYCLGQTEMASEYAHVAYRNVSINNDGIAEYKIVCTGMSLSHTQYTTLANYAKHMIRLMFVQ